LSIYNQSNAVFATGQKDSKEGKIADSVLKGLEKVHKLRSKIMQALTDIFVSG